MGRTRRALLRVGLVVLHKSRFGAMGGSGKPRADRANKIAACVGAFIAWESQFRERVQGRGD
jgi:hypothetical protein